MNLFNNKAGKEEFAVRAKIEDAFLVIKYNYKRIFFERLVHYLIVKPWY
jgi:hypothetical protein